MNPPTVDCFDLNILNIDRAELPGFVTDQSKEGSCFGYINAYGFYQFFQQEGVQKVFQDQDYTICDGLGASLVIWGQTGRWVPKNTPASWFDEYLNLQASQRKKIMIWGHTQEEVEELKKRLPQVYSGLEIVSFLDGFHKNFEEVLETVERLKPDTLLIARGMPRQEESLSRFKEASVSCRVFCIGATLLYKTGLQREAPDWVRNYGGEWLWRWASSPIKMAKRYFFGNLFVLFLTLKLFLKRKLR